MTVIMVLLCSPMAIAEESEPSYSQEISFVKIFDLFPEDENGEIEINAEISRAQMAEIICKIARLGNNASAFVSIPDIAEYTAYEGYIKSAVESGILTLDYDGSFYPERTVTVSEAGKIIATMLGYSKKAMALGGFSRGYTNVAATLGIFGGIKKGYNEKLTYADFARMLYNSQDIETLEPAVIKNNTVSYETTGKTFLNEVMGYDKIEGRVTDNGITSMTGDTELIRGRVKINGAVLETAPQSSHIESYIGKNVIAYSTYTKTNTKEKPETLVGFFEDEESVVYDIDDFKKLEKSSITFTKNKKDIKNNISLSPAVIYNGKAVQSFDESNFDYYSGTVTLISSKKTKTYDIIIIEGYVSWYITAYDSEKRIYTDKTKHITNIAGEELSYIDLDDQNSIINIYNHYGQKTDIDHIYPFNLVDICKNGNYIKIIIAPKAKFDTVISEIIDNDTVVAEDKEYKISEKYIKLGNSIPNPGTVCSLYINTFGKIVRIDDVSGVGEKQTAYLIESAPSRNFTGVRVHMLLETGKNYAFDVADKVRLIFGDGSESTMNEDKLYENLRGYSGLVLYKMNENGEIKLIEMPSAVGEERKEGKFGCIYSGSGYYESGRNNVDGKFALSPTATKVFAINENGDNDDKKYSVTTMDDFSGNTDIIKTAYNFEQDSLYADYITIITEKGGNYSLGSGWYMVTDISNAVDEDGNPTVKVTTNTLGGSAPEKIFYGDEEVFRNVSDSMDTDNRYDIKIGDIIRCSERLGKVKRVELFYRSDMENITDPSGAKGNFPGSIGYFNEATPGISNPFRLGYPTHNANSYTTVGRVILGYAYNVDSRGFLTYTTRDLTCMPYSAEADSKYLTEAMSLPTNIVLVTYSGDEVSVKQGTKYDILTYKNVGSNCSRIIRYMEYGTNHKFVVINGEIGG